MIRIKEMGMKTLISQLTVIITAILAVSSLLGCSNSYNPDQALAEQRARLGQTEMIGGTSFFKEQPGLFVANSPLESVASGSHYAFKVEIDLQGSFELVSHAQSGLKNGLSLTFSREANSPRLRLIAQAGSNTADWSAAMTDIDATLPISLSVDIHNDEEGAAHVLIWSGEILLMNSTEVPTAPSPGLGQGVHWGVKLKSSTVLSIIRSEPRYED